MHPPFAKYAEEGPWVRAPMRCETRSPVSEVERSPHSLPVTVWMQRWGGSTLARASE